MCIPLKVAFEPQSGPSSCVPVEDQRFINEYQIVRMLTENDVQLLPLMIDLVPFRGIPQSFRCTEIRVTPQPNNPPKLHAQLYDCDYKFGPLLILTINVVCFHFQLQDTNVKLIRELRAEIDRLKTMISPVRKFLLLWHIK